MRIIEHEGLLSEYFTSENEVAICKVFDACDLQQAIELFEDTRTEEQVNDMCDMLGPVFGIEFSWLDELEAYVIE